jgi:hypothetical protein
MEQAVERLSRLVCIQQELLETLFESLPGTKGLTGDVMSRFEEARLEADALRRLPDQVAPDRWSRAGSGPAWLDEGRRRRPAEAMLVARDVMDVQDAAARWSERLARGEALRAAWVREGLLVSSRQLAEQWHRTRQALDQACARGELFAVRVGKNKYYPAAFLELAAEAVKRINLALVGDDSTAKFVFWNARHGALGHRTVAEALDAGHLIRVMELARGWSEERGVGSASTA